MKRALLATNPLAVGPMRKLLLAASMALAPMAAHAGVSVEGSSFSVSGTNTPGIPTTGPNAIIEDGITQVIPTTNGPLTLVIDETPDGTPGGEWISFF
jgi:hypothetical protein